MIGEKELEKYMDRDFLCLSHSSVNFDAIGNRYCQCGKKRSEYPCEFANFWYTNVSCSGRRETSSDDILKVDRNTIFLTKKNLMMNQFLEYTTPPPSPPLKNVTTEVDEKISRLHPYFSRSRFAIHDGGEGNATYTGSYSAKCDHSPKITPTFCSSSSFFLDKRIVSLLRGITLYWFICLNTVLAKSELVKKRSSIALVSDINCDSATALLDVISAADLTSVPPFCHDLAELQVSLNLLENAFDLESDILWNLLRNYFNERSQLQSHAIIILPFDQHLKNNLFEQFVRKLVGDWITLFRPISLIPAPYNYVPCSSADSVNHLANRIKALQPTQDQHCQDDAHYQYNRPTNAIRASCAYPSIDYRDHSAEVLFHANRMSLRQVASLNRSEAPMSDRITPLNLTFYSRSASTDRLNHALVSDNLVSLYPNIPCFSPITPAPSMPAPEVTGANFLHNSRISPGRMSVPAFWKMIADMFGDAEMNAILDSGAAISNAEPCSEVALMRNDCIEEESDEGSQEEIVDVVGSWLCSEASVESEQDVRLHEGQLAPQYINGTPNISLEDFQRYAPIYNIHIQDDEHTDVDETMRCDHSEPMASHVSVSLGIDQSIMEAGSSAPAIDADCNGNPSTSCGEYSDVKTEKYDECANEEETGGSTSNNSDTKKEVDAPSSESDEKELIELTNPLDVHQVPLLENRFFLPQGIANNGEQQCAEFNMWQSPWVNSVQLLREEPLQAQLKDESGDNLPEYRLWTMPQINGVHSLNLALAHASQRPTASEVSRMLLSSSRSSNANSNASSEYKLWSSPKLVDVEQLSSVEGKSIETSNVATNPMPNEDSVSAASSQFPQFVPIIRNRVVFSQNSAFHPYNRQPAVPDGGIMESHEMRSQPLMEQAEVISSEQASSQVEEAGAYEEVRNMKSENEGSPSAPLDSPYLFRPLAPAFKVLNDVQQPMLRSESGLEYQVNGRRLFAFQHELDAKSDDPYQFQPKYEVSPNNKGCQTEPELPSASALANVARNLFPVHAEPSTTSRIARPHHSPNLTVPQGWPSPHHHQPAGQAAPQHHWPYQIAVSAMPFPTSQPWPVGQLRSPSHPAPPIWASGQHQDQQTWAAGPLQYYGLNDMFNHLGQPGFANVGEYGSPLAMSFSSS